MLSSNLLLGSGNHHPRPHLNHQLQRDLSSSSPYQQHPPPHQTASHNVLMLAALKKKSDVSLFLNLTLLETQLPRDPLRCYYLELKQQ